MILPSGLDSGINSLSKYLCRSTCGSHSLFSFNQFDPHSSQWRVRKVLFDRQRVLGSRARDDVPTFEHAHESEFHFHVGEAHPEAVARPGAERDHGDDRTRRPPLRRVPGETNQKHVTS